MHIIRGNAKYRLISRNEFGVNLDQSVHFRDQLEIRNFLADLLWNDAAFAQLRNAVLRCRSHANMRLTDRHDVLRLAAKMILRGDCLRVVATQYVPSTQISWTPEEPLAAFVKPIVPPKLTLKKVVQKPLKIALPTPKYDQKYNPMRTTMLEASMSGIPCIECALSTLTDSVQAAVRRTEGEIQAAQASATAAVAHVQASVDEALAQKQAELAKTQQTLADEAQAASQRVEGEIQAAQASATAAVAHVQASVDEALAQKQAELAKAQENLAKAQQTLLDEAQAASQRAEGEVVAQASATVAHVQAGADEALAQKTAERNQTQDI